MTAQKGENNGKNLIYLPREYWYKARKAVLYQRIIPLYYYPTEQVAFVVNQFRGLVFSPSPLQPSELKASFA